MYSDPRGWSLLGNSPSQFKEDRDLFFGRYQETDELVSLITAHPLVLLYAQSGAGKSSLLNARVIPELEEEGFEVFGPLRVQGQVPPNWVEDKKANIYTLNALLALHEDKDLAQLSALTLPEFLKRQPPLLNMFKEPLPRVIIFDQFEELFTYYPERWKDRATFFEQVRDAVEASRAMNTATAAPLRVVFAMREDYIAELDPYVALLPEKLRTRYRLERLDENDALLAIIKPLQGTGRDYSPGVAEHIVENLRKIPGQSAVDEPKLGPYVEPVQLQVVCQSIWQALRADEVEITERHLKDYGDVNWALSAFYERSIKAVSDMTGVEEAVLRSWFERTLITADGMRAPVYRGDQNTEGMPNEAVDLLDGMQLLKSEMKGANARWYELAHDRFIEPVRKSNERWLAGQSIAEQARLRLEARAERWRQGHAGLLDAVELSEAKRLLRGRDTSSKDLRALVDASQASAQQKRLKWLMWGTAGLVVLLIGMIGVSVYALSQTKAARVAEAKARSASADAEEQRDIARDASGLAEKQRSDIQKALDDLKAEKIKTEQQRKAAEDALIDANKAREQEKTQRHIAERAVRRYEEEYKISQQRLETLRSGSYLESDPKPVKPKPRDAQAFKKIGDDAKYATSVLNDLVGGNLNVPKIVALSEGDRNSYWDGDAVYAPPPVQHLPDVTYIGVAHVFTSNTSPNAQNAGPGQSGAIFLSYADIYASLIKQKRLGQTAQEADWTIAPGGVAWLKGEDVEGSSDNRPLRSLKSPGTAYDDPVLGKDRQLTHIRNLSAGQSQAIDDHTIMGIPNKAFYETAIQIGSDRAGAIWTAALKMMDFGVNPKFKDLAQFTYKSAGKLYGDDSAERQAVKKAWDTVGISVTEQ